MIVGDAIGVTVGEVCTEAPWGGLSDRMGKPSLPRHLERAWTSGRVQRARRRGVDAPLEAATLSGGSPTSRA